MQLKPIHKEAITSALEKAIRYRVLNEPLEAESICRDVLELDGDNQQAIATLLLALTDQFPRGLGPRVRQANELAARLKSLVFMGGNARVPGNVTPAAEFNIWFDPEAAAAVLASAIPRIVMFGLDITNHAPIRKPQFDAIVEVGTPLTRLMRHDMGPRFARDPSATYYVWDCITAAWLIDPSVVTVSQRLPIEVDTTFGPSYGGTRVLEEAPADGRLVEVMLDLDIEKFYGMYEDLLTRPIK